MHFTTSFTIFLATAYAQVNFEWDCTNSLGPCNNACFATFHGLANGLLTYDSDSNNADDRREDSGCFSNASPCTGGRTNYDQWGDSCDEYPFASTTEGGQGSILRCVPLSENQSQGGQLSRNLYPQLNNGDQFRIVVRNYGGARFCDNTQAQNDGSQFTYSGGNYQNAKRGRELGFHDARPRLTGTGKFREFEDENGEKLMLLDREYNGTFIGQTVTNADGGSVKISKELF